MNQNTGPGVPTAIPRALDVVKENVGVSALDRLWIFPPFVRGRKESGLLTMSVRGEEGPHRLLLLSYSAEETGRGVTFDCHLSEEGAAPRDRFQRLMDGVVRRSGEGHTDPRVIEINGDEEALASLIGEFASSEEATPS